MTDKDTHHLSKILKEVGQAAGDGDMFDIAPASLWLEDYSGIQTLFAQWRAGGISNLGSHLLANPHLVEQCTEQMRVINVNRRTLSLFEANDLEHLRQNLGQIFSGEMLAGLIGELVQLWNGQRHFAGHSVNYTLSGRRLDVQIRGSILGDDPDDWSRVLVAVEDVTERLSVQSQLLASEAYARGLFQYSPVSLWVEDFSAVRCLFDEIRRAGISDFRTFTDVHPEFVSRCAQEVRVINVNQVTLGLFVAPDQATLLNNLDKVFRDDDMHPHFREQLIDLWEGKLFQQREVVNHTLTGDELYLYLQFSVLPGHEESWDLVLVALTDITARKKAEAYLEFLGKHDSLTKQHNRGFYVEELNRIERKKLYPVSIIIIDLNGLKVCNDALGHAAGDDLLRRFGEILDAVVAKPACASRIGGDEFAILLPSTDAEDATDVMEQIIALVALNNQYYSATTLSISMGCATAVDGERLELAAQRADKNMYQRKRAFYSDDHHERRRLDRDAGVSDV
ncbi:MAG: diguanylate cyclase [Candidimonas sp.]|nr:MAG: diguanylate cyclase [Candidimonas sp.]TAM24608.1 MAG: diguanylate cyclase [Candidimonas sp.]TAM77993.1 MAG: diguanylate cyclase [Candidimonas sp.]